MELSFNLLGPSTRTCFDVNLLYIKSGKYPILDPKDFKPSNLLLEF